MTDEITEPLPDDPEVDVDVPNDPVPEPAGPDVDEDAEA